MAFILNLIKLNELNMTSVFFFYSNMKIYNVPNNKPIRACCLAPCCKRCSLIGEPKADMAGSFN